jgi:Protein of unknown function (DUF2752)
VAESWDGLTDSAAALSRGRCGFQIMQSLRFVSVAYDRPRQLAIASLVWLGLAAGSAFLFFFNPASPTNQFFPKCPFRLLTGWQCPGCGSTRACYELLHLHPIAAFKLNPLMMLTLPFIVYGFLGFTRSAITGKPQRRVFIPALYLQAWLVLLIFFWIFRNTPWYPFVS